jgi:hypothetical protein
MTRTTTTASVRLRRLMPAALFAAAAALGASTFTDPAIATAERVWDVVAYGKCLDDNPKTDDDEARAQDYYCCIDSGGVWDPANGSGHECEAPPAERPVPPRVGPPAQTSAPLQSAPGIPPTTQTFVPGPAKQG